MAFGFQGQLFVYCAEIERQLPPTGNTRCGHQAGARRCLVYGGLNVQLWQTQTPRLSIVVEYAVKLFTTLIRRVVNLPRR